MNKVLKVVLMVVAACAAYYGVEYMRTKSVTKQAAGEKIEELRAEAEKKYPGMAKTDALKAVAQADTVSQLNAVSGVEEKRQSAAYMFFGFYFMNTQARMDYCKQHGTDLKPFIDAFAEKNKAEQSRARSTLLKIGVEPESLIPVLSEQFASVVEQDMKDVAMGAKVPVERTCALFNENAELLANEIKLTPEIRTALMAN